MPLSTSFGDSIFVILSKPEFRVFVMVARKADAAILLFPSPPLNHLVWWLSHFYMQNIIERYKMHLVDLSSNSSATEQNIEHWKQEAALSAKKIEFLEASKRMLMGENLESCSMEDLNKLERQLEQGIGNIRGVKALLLSGRVTQLTEKTRVLSDEIELLQNQSKETQLIFDSLVAPQDIDNQPMDIDTDLYIGCPGRGKI